MRARNTGCGITISGSHQAFSKITKEIAFAERSLDARLVEHYFRRSPPACSLSCQCPLEESMPRLPTMVRHAVLDLYGESADVVRARTDEEQAAKRFQKLDCVRKIEDHFISQEAAFKGIHLAWKNRVPFCLFLRNYSMGHKPPRESSIPATGRAARFLNVSQPSGGRVIRELGLALQDRVMLISIANSRRIPAPSFHRCALCKFGSSS